MSKFYVGSNNGTAAEPEKIYIGITDVATEVKKMYIGNENGKAVLIYPNFSNSFLSNFTIDTTATSVTVRRLSNG